MSVGLLGDPLTDRDKRSAKRHKHIGERKYDGVTNVRLLHGDVRQMLATLPDESVHCVITSPPYFGLRDYHIDGQLGLEPTPDKYVANMIVVFREVRRVLRSDGTFWLNIGDSYAGGGHGGGGSYESERNWRKGNPDKNQGNSNRDGLGRVSGLKPKDLIGIPWMLAFALRADGWWLRQDIIWAKGNPMPESVIDRCTKSHEYLFLLTKSANYYFDNEAIKDNAQYAGQRILLGDKSLSKGQSTGVGVPFSGNSLKDSVIVADGHNKHSVWTINTEANPDMHFATFPQDLVQPCILAGTSARGVCKQCGSPWERVIEKGDERPGIVRGANPSDFRAIQGPQRGGVGGRSVETIGWTPTCHCACDEVVPATVLDPFSGSGTTALVASQLRCHAIGIELNPEYLEMSRRRIETDTVMLGLARITS